MNRVQLIIAKIHPVNPYVAGVARYMVSPSGAPHTAFLEIQLKTSQPLLFNAIISCFDDVYIIWLNDFESTLRRKHGVLYSMLSAHSKHGVRILRMRSNCSLGLLKFIRSCTCKYDCQLLVYMLLYFLNISHWCVSHHFLCTMQLHVVLDISLVHCNFIIYHSSPLPFMYLLPSMYPKCENKVILLLLGP